MRITYIILLLTCFGMQSLAQTNTDSFNPAVTIAKVKKKSAIKMNTQDSINPDFEVVRGTHLVFEYEFRAKEYTNVIKRGVNNA